MDQEKRRGDSPLPDNLEQVLNEAQRQALPGVRLAGWKLCFLRRPMFQEPVLVLHHPLENHTAILDTDGKIRRRPDLRMRVTEDDSPSSPSHDPLIWTR